MIIKIVAKFGGTQYAMKAYLVDDRSKGTLIKSQ